MPHCTLSVVSAFLLAAAPHPDAVEPTHTVLPPLAAPVEIDFDSFDIPTIRAKTLRDAACVQGWIHARERFLQMDLARREPAGEIGQLIPEAVERDRATIALGLRAVAETAVARLPEEHRMLLEAYAAGVNAQLAAAKPFEYQLLKVECAPWTPVDSMLVQLAMALYLDGSDGADRARTPLARAFGESVASFLTSSRSVLDMTIDGSPSPAAPALPGADALDLRPRSAGGAEPRGEAADPEKPITQPGSNAFAVAAARTRNGRAIVGNDMHLALMAPNFWYRVDLQWETGRLVGLSLPGVPLLVQGTNGHVAWGFTNLTADLCDLVLVERTAEAPELHHTPKGPAPIVRRRVVLGSGPTAREIETLSTAYGPVVATLPDGRLLAIRSPILLDAAIDFGLFDMCGATTLESALECARRWQGPPQNVLVASGDGRIGWTISGSLPLRDAPTPRIVDWREAQAWRGSIPADDKPTIVDPASGILTSGNQLPIAPTGALRGVLGGDEAHGDRAHRLREVLAGRTDWDEAALHGVQLDVYSPRLVRWRSAALAALGAEPLAEPAESARRAIAAWDGAVTADSSAPVLLDAFRREMALAFAGWLAATGDGARAELSPREAAAAIDDEALLRSLESRAPHLCGEAEAGDAWMAAARAWLARAADASLAKEARRSERATRPAPEDGDASPVFVMRGDRNRLAMRHPAADSLGAAARLAAMPNAALPGHPTTVRVQTPSFGASQRSSVAPSHLEDAILVTPAGQSGLPTSPHFRSLHRPWQDGLPFPLLPGPSARRIVCSPTAP
jgi:penicillin amidase